MRPSRYLIPVAVTMLTAATTWGQTLATGSLTGKYFVRHVEFTTDGSNNVTDARSITGSINFNGTGNYSLTGQQVIGTGAPASFTASGSYSVNAAGIAAIANPQKPALTINARYGVEAVIGSSTEAADNTFDIFVAIPAPAAALTNAAVNATWSATDFELTGASTSQVRDSIVALTLDGAGNISALSATGHAANFSAGASMNQPVTGGTYSVNSDGTGAITFPLPSGHTAANSLLSPAARTMAVSKSTNVLMGSTAGAHDIFIAIRNAATPVTLNSGTRFWVSGLRVDSTGSSNAYAASTNTIAADSYFISSRRLHETGSATALNETASAAYTTAADGTGFAGAAQIAVETAGYVGANTGNAFDPTGYEIAFGTGIPAVSGTGVFVNPQGIVNAASGAPAGDAVSPGEFITIYGSGLAAAPATATTLPFPKSLGNVTVAINGTLAAIDFVSASQINCIVPYELTGSTATIVVTSSGAVSNTVTVPAARTSPGIFSQDSTGVTDGAITHADNSLVNAASPAKKGEVVVMYLSGLGALSIPVADGNGAAGLNNVTTQFEILVNGIAVQPVAVLYYGLSVEAGLYQINFTVPATLTVSGELPLAILTPDAFTDEITIAVQ